MFRIVLVYTVVRTSANFLIQTCWLPQYARCQQPTNVIQRGKCFHRRTAELTFGSNQHIMKQGTVWLNSVVTEHKAAELLQARLNLHGMPSLGDVLQQNTCQPNGPVLFKSCGWAVWNLAAARLASRQIHHF